MRILHLSDVHIGVENYGRPATEADVEALPVCFAPGTDRSAFVGMSTRLLDFLATLDAAVEHALTQGIDLVLFAGDAYKSRDPSQTHQREFAARIARIANAGIPVFLTVGNHDLPHVANRATALEIFPTLSVTNVTVGSTLSTYNVPVGSTTVQVVALPWVRIGQFMAKEETRDLTLEQIKQAVESRLAEHGGESSIRLRGARPYPQAADADAEPAGGLSGQPAADRFLRGGARERVLCDRLGRVEGARRSDPKPHVRAGGSAPHADDRRAHASR